MAITANRDVLCCIYDDDGDPVEGATVSFVLNSFDRDGGCFVTPQTISALTNASGEATVSVWPNSAGEDGSYYSVTAVSAEGQTLLNGQAYVADVDNQLLTDILVDSAVALQVIERRNLPLFTGQDFEFSFSVTNPDGSPAVLDFYVPRMRVYDAQGGTLVFDTDTDSGITLAVAGDVFSGTIDAATFAAWSSGYFHKMSIENLPDEYFISYGTIYIQ